jgi:hypothetical protein
VAIKLLFESRLIDRAYVKQCSWERDTAGRSMKKSVCQGLGGRCICRDEIAAKVSWHGRQCSCGGLFRSRNLPGGTKLKHDLAFSNESELVACDPLDGRRVLAKLVHFDAQLCDVTAYLGIFGRDVFELGLERAHPRQAFGLKDEDGHRDERESKRTDGKCALNEGVEGRHNFAGQCHEGARTDQ